MLWMIRKGLMFDWSLISYSDLLTLEIWLFWLSRPILHKYANEDVSLGAWFIGLEVEHIDDRNLCCGTPPGTRFFHYILYSSFFM